MKKRIILGFCIVLLLFCIIGTATAKTWYVDDSGGADFTKIQDAVGAASGEDTIIVRDGTYIENIVIYPPRTIRSENGSVNCIVQAADTSRPVFLGARGGITIEGFTITGATGPLSGYKLAGIYLGFGGCRILNNNITNNRYGIWWDGSGDNKIYLNNFIDNGYDATTYSISHNDWNSTSKITYTYKGNTCTSYLGNYWDVYTGTDANKDGVGDTPNTCSMDLDKDNYPLMEPFENYFVEEEIIPTPISITPTPTPTSSPTLTPTPTLTPPEIPTGEEKGIPGFEAVFAIAGLLGVVYIFRRRK